MYGKCITIKSYKYFSVAKFYALKILVVASCSILTNIFDRIRQTEPSLGHGNMRTKMNCENC